jgi:hypothetical protein
VTNAGPLAARAPVRDIHPFAAVIAPAAHTPAGQVAPAGQPTPAGQPALPRRPHPLSFRPVPAATTNKEVFV